MSRESLHLHTDLESSARHDTVSGPGRSIPDLSPPLPTDSLSLTFPDDVSASADQSFFRSLRLPSTFRIVRHGQSEGNARRIFQGQLDLPLDSVGKTQAQALGSWFASRSPGYILSSPLKRAAETASIIAATCGIDSPGIDSSFMEFDTGSWTGITMEEAQQKHPAVCQKFSAFSWDAVPGAEPSAHIYDRAMRAWSVLVDAAITLEDVPGARSTSLVAVTHGGFIQWLVRSTFGNRSWMPLVPTDNCSIFELHVAPTSVPGKPLVQWRRINYCIPDLGPLVLPVF